MVTPMKVPKATAVLMSLIAGQVWGTDLLSAATVSFSSWTTWQTDWNESDMNTDDLVVTFPATVPGALAIANENGGDPVLIGPSILSIDDWAYWFRGGAAAAAEGNGGIFDNTLKLVAFGDNQNVFQTNLHDNVNLSGIVDVQNAIFTGINLPAGTSGTLYVLGAAERGRSTNPITFSVSGSSASGTAGEGIETASTADRQTGFLTFTWDATADVSDVSASVRMSGVATTNDDWAFLGFAASLNAVPEPSAIVLASGGILMIIIGSMRSCQRSRRR